MIKWLGRVKSILSSGTFAVLPNGIPRKQFVCKRGVRQGDPLSPFMYSFGSDLLKSAVNDLVRFIDRLKQTDADFPINPYAEDKLLIMPMDKGQLLVLKESLHKFSQSTGLKINFGKSHMVPIYVPAEIMEELAADFGCQIAKVPFTYLGLPLGTTRPSIIDLSPLVCRLERKITSSSRFFV
jgi:hypothetical protein